MIADHRTLRGVPATLTVTWLDALGEPAAPETPVTVTVETAAGDEVLPAGTATTGDGTTRTVTVPAADTAELGWLVATWTDGTTERTTVAEIVGGFYFTVADLRAVETTLADQARYPTPTIQRARAETEAEFEAICARAFVPRYERRRLPAPAAGEVLLPYADLRSVRSITVEGTAWTQAQLEELELYSYGVLAGHFSAYPLTVEWEHGLDRPPAEIVRAAMARTRWRLNAASSGIPDRATSFTVTEGGTYRLATAGLTKVGTDWIDATLSRWTVRHPGVG